MIDYRILAKKKEKYFSNEVTITDFFINLWLAHTTKI